MFARISRLSQPLSSSLPPSTPAFFASSTSLSAISNLPARPLSSTVHRPLSSLLSTTRPLSSNAAQTSSSPTPSSAPRYGEIVKERFNKDWEPAGLSNPKFVPRTVQGRQKDIRVSPWKLNLLAAQVRRLRVSDARLQLKFSIKRKADLVSNVIRKTVNLADIRYNLKPEELEVKKCFVTSAKPLKRIRYHARGKVGRKTRRHAHLNVEVGEIDFEARIAKAETKGQREKWIGWREEARQVGEKAREEADELRALQGLMPASYAVDEEELEPEDETDGEFEEVEEADFTEKEPEEEPKK